MSLFSRSEQWLLFVKFMPCVWSGQSHLSDKSDCFWEVCAEGLCWWTRAIDRKELESLVRGFCNCCAGQGVLERLCTETENWVLNLDWKIWPYWKPRGSRCTPLQQNSTLSSGLRGCHRKFVLILVSWSKMSECVQILYVGRIRCRSLF